MLCSAAVRARRAGAAPRRAAPRTRTGSEPRTRIRVRDSDPVLTRTDRRQCHAGRFAPFLGMEGDAAALAQQARSVCVCVCVCVHATTGMACDVRLIGGRGELSKLGEGGRGAGASIRKLGGGGDVGRGRGCVGELAVVLSLPGPAVVLPCPGPATRDSERTRCRPPLSRPGPGARRHASCRRRGRRLAAVEPRDWTGSESLDPSR